MANFSEANLLGAIISISEATHSRTDLRMANFSEANLLGAKLSGANLSEANLSGAYLLFANLSEANLSGANLNGADLWKAKLSGAYLRLADLSGANLSEANLSEANLSEAGLRGASSNDDNGIMFSFHERINSRRGKETDLSGAKNVPENINEIADTGILTDEMADEIIRKYDEATKESEE